MGLGGRTLRDLLREDEERQADADAKAARRCGRHGTRKGKPAAGASSDAPSRGAAAAAASEPPRPLTGDPHARIAIVGGGAAGLASAVAAGRELAAAGRAGTAGVVVFEADERVGRSMLATGNGRCNFSNASIEAGRYRNAGFVGEALVSLIAGFSAARDLGDPVHRFFSDLGMLSREEGEGRLYPATGKASTVVDVLRAAAAGLGVVEACGRRVTRIEVPREEGGLFHLRFADGSIEHAAAVVLAVGGKHAACEGRPQPKRRGKAPFRSDAPAADGAASCDVRHGAAALLPDRYGAVPLHPVLGPLAADDPLRALDNIRVRANVWLASKEGGDARLSAVLLDPSLDPAGWRVADEAQRAWARDHGVSDYAYAPSPAQMCGVPCGGLKAIERGEVLFRSYGVSGICLFNLSRFAEPGDVLLIDFLPQVRACDAESFLFARRKRLCASDTALAGAHAAPLTAEAFLRGMLLPQVARAVLGHAGLEPDAPFGKADVPALARALKAFPLTVEGIGDERQCQVLRGGLAVEAFDPRTMESRLDAGLFAAGEALDVDAPCGGYNLHWAWASGLLAGRTAARLVAGWIDAGSAPRGASRSEALGAAEATEASAARRIAEAAEAAEAPAVRTPASGDQPPRAAGGEGGPHA